MLVFLLPPRSISDKCQHAEKKRLYRGGADCRGRSPCARATYRTMSALAPSAAGAGGAADEHPLGALEKALQDSAETLNALALGVHSFRYDSQASLFAGANQLVRDLRELQRAAAAVDATLPVDVLEAIDRGRNPELCTYEMLEGAAEASAAARGKLDCMATFRLALEREMRRAGVEVPQEEEIRAAQAPLEAAGGGGEAVLGTAALPLPASGLGQ